MRCSKCGKRIKEIYWIGTLNYCEGCYKFEIKRKHDNKIRINTLRQFVNLKSTEELEQLGYTFFEIHEARR